MRRPLAMPSATASVDPELAKCVRACQTDRQCIVYVRKSNPTAEAQNANYLRAQFNIPQQLRDAGVPGESITVFQSDTGKSGALSRAFRADLQKTWDALGTGRTGLLVAIDVARFFRDYTDKGPSEFASRMARHSVSVITQINGVWTCLHMADDADNRTFRDLARSAAIERKNIRARTSEARETAVGLGAYSGAPAPFGWAAQPKQNRYESSDGKEHAGHLYVYPPHAEYKLAVMRLSTRPDIRSRRQLRDLLVKKGMKIPPFAPEIAVHAFSRSVICRAKMTENGLTRAVTKTDAFYPSVQLLIGMLTEPLAIGDRLYGSGRHGAWKARRLERQAAEQDQLSDHQLRENREYVDNRPELAICKTPEDLDLYYAVCEKWAPVDMRTAHESKYEEEPKNEACIRKVGRVIGTGNKQQNPWAGKVWCGKHGLTPDGNIRHEYYLRRNPKRGEWCCSKSYDAGETALMCAYWSDEDKIGRILDYHLFFHLHVMLQKEVLFDSIIEERQALKRRIDALREEIKHLDAERKRQMQRQDDLERRLHGMDEAFIRAQADTFFDENVRPVLALLSERNKQLRDAEASGQVEMSEQSEEEIRKDLQTAVFDAEKLSDDKKRELVHTFVDSVEVLVPDFTGECLIYFNWSSVITDDHGQRVTDTLLASKPISNRKREWTAAEDAAVRELYPLQSGATYDEIRARLQPGRRVDVIAKRAWELGVRRPFRSKGWIEECRLAERTWSQDNPDVLYLSVPNKRLVPGAHLLWHDAEGEWTQKYEVYEVVVGKGVRAEIDLPDKIRTGLQIHKNMLCP